MTLAPDVSFKCLLGEEALGHAGSEDYLDPMHLALGGCHCD
jgi:hypothetical protein